MTLLLLLLSTLACAGETFHAELSAQDQTYSFESRREEKHVDNVFRDAAGNALMKERVEYAGGQLLSYSYEQLQVGDRGKIEMRGSKLEYEFTRGGVTKHESGAIEENTLVPDGIAPFLRRHWDELAQGETVKARLAVLERLETVGFKFFALKESSADLLEIQMKPSSFFLALFAPQFRFALEKQPPHRVRWAEGAWPVITVAKRPVTGRLLFKR